MGFAATATLSDVKDDGISKFAVKHRSSGLTVFGYLVFGVVDVCPEEQVRWVDTRRIIAVMQDVASLRDGSDKELVRDPVCKVQTQLAIASPVGLPQPEIAPGFSDVAYSGKETVLQLSLPSATTLANARTEYAVSSRYFARDGIEGERRSANLADPGF